MLNLLGRLFFLEFRNLHFGLRRFGRLRLRGSFVKTVGRIERFTFGDVGRLRHGQADAADKLDIDFAFSAAAYVAPSISFKVENDARDHGGCQGAMETKRIDEEAMQA